MKQLIFLVAILLSCSTPNKEESKLIISYVEKVSGMKVSTGDIILINSSGCHGCIENGLNFLEINNLYDSYQALIISEKALEEYERSVNRAKFKVDKENLLEKLNISESGFVVVRFKNSGIDTMYSLNPETNLNILKKYPAEMSLLHVKSCGSCIRE